LDSTADLDAVVVKISLWRAKLLERGSFEDRKGNEFITLA